MTVKQKLIKQWAKEFGISEKCLSGILTKLQLEHLYWESLEKKWLYPSMGDDQKSNPMLDAMFSIEQRKGIVLYLPYNERGEKK